MTLDQLQVGQSARVVGYLNDDEALLQRILEMGVNRGITVKLVRVAPLGDPLEVSLRGYQLSVRRSEAKLIQVEPA
ncbi:MAG: hypothetical protein BIFFINMI_02957 [Phycisphaerae bacterium]|nr:hypothetical protein [Phycisphaerae bacterium]